MSDIPEKSDGPDSLLGFEQLNADYHLTNTESEVIKSFYAENRNSITDSIKNNLKTFIQRDYAEANRQYLGGFNGIMELQKALNITSIDGLFGPETFYALIEFQKKNGLIVDGIAGPDTQKKLGINIISDLPLEKKKSKPNFKTVNVQTSKGNTLNNILNLKVLPLYEKSIQGLEENMKMLNLSRKENTGVVGGIGDTIIEGAKWIGVTNAKTGKEIYAESFEKLKEQAKFIAQDLIKDLTGKTISDADKKHAEGLLKKLEQLSGQQFQKISWGQSIFTSLGISDIAGDPTTMKNRVKIFARTTIGLAEGATDAVIGLAQITGKAVAMIMAYVNNDTRGIIQAEVQNIFSQLTLENAKKALDLLPKALEEFSNLPIDQQADGFGVFFGNLLLVSGIGVKIVKGANYSMKLGGRAVRMAKHKGLGQSTPLALAGVGQGAAGAVALPVGLTVRAGEIDILPGNKKAIKKTKDNQKSLVYNIDKKEVVESQKLKNAILGSDIGTQIQNGGLTQIDEQNMLIKKSPKGIEGEDVLWIDGVEVLPAKKENIPTRVDSNIIDAEFVDSTGVSLRDELGGKKEQIPQLGYNNEAIKIPKDIFMPHLSDKINPFLSDITTKTRGSVEDILYPTKKKFHNLIDSENYQKELDAIRLQKESGQITQKEYREAQKELIMERALQRSNEMFLEGERILRANPDITPDTLKDQLYTHFNTNDIELSRLQKSMINSIPEVLQEAIEIRQKHISKYFQNAGKEMPKKMEDIEYMINHDPEIYLHFFNEILFDSGRPIPPYTMENYKKLVALGYKLPSIDVTSHPTTIIRKNLHDSMVPNALENSWGYYNPATNVISIKLGLGSGLELEVLEHEYIHFINKLSGEALLKSHIGEFVKLTNVVQSGLYDDLHSKIASRIGKNVYHSVENFTQPKLWSSMQDEILAYLGGNNRLPDSFTGYLNTGQVNGFNQGKLSVPALKEMTQLHAVLDTLNKTLSNKSVLSDIIRTSGTIEIAYDRLMQKFPDILERYPKKFSDLLNSQQHRIEFEVSPGVKVAQYNSGIIVFMEKGNTTIDINIKGQYNAVLDTEVAMLKKTAEKIGDKPLYDLTTTDIQEIARDNISIRSTNQGYTFTVDSVKNELSISKGENVVSYKTIEEFVQGCDEWKNNPESIFKKDALNPEYPFGAPQTSIIDRITILNNAPNMISIRPGINPEITGGTTIRQGGTTFQIFSNKPGEFVPEISGVGSGNITIGAVTKGEFDKLHPVKSREITDFEKSIFGDIRIDQNGSTTYKNGSVLRRDNGIISSILFKDPNGRSMFSFDDDGKLILSKISNGLEGVRQLDDLALEFSFKNGDKHILPRTFILGQ